jgi:hypothetical protein
MFGRGGLSRGSSLSLLVLSGGSRKSFAQSERMNAFEITWLLAVSMTFTMRFSVAMLSKI